ncbi:MAG: hypothetical protein Ta2A_11940 [Treponemataceae bacterium]|nr:MAG: hypothetical protein Ta2A_11940 [Treponemataceae bacterium]
MCLRVSPVSEEYAKLNDFTVETLYEVIMNYPIESVREGYLQQNTGVLASVKRNAEKLKSMGYSDKDIERMKGDRNGG